VPASEVLRLAARQGSVSCLIFLTAMTSNSAWLPLRGRRRWIHCLKPIAMFRFLIATGAGRGARWKCKQEDVLHKPFPRTAAGELHSERNDEDRPKRFGHSETETTRLALCSRREIDWIEAVGRDYAGACPFGRKKMSLAARAAAPAGVPSGTAAEFPLRPSVHDCEMDRITVLSAGENRDLAG